MSDPLASLRPRFRARCQEDLAKIDAYSKAPEDTSALMDTCHKLAGVAGGFGAKDLSKAASDIELKILAGAWPDAQALDLVRALLRTHAELGT